jgi:hypothetical protein
LPDLVTIHALKIVLFRFSACLFLEFDLGHLPTLIFNTRLPKELKTAFLFILPDFGLLALQGLPGLQRAIPLPLSHLLGS